MRWIILAMTLLATSFIANAQTPGQVGVYTCTPGTTVCAWVATPPAATIDPSVTAAQQAQAAAVAQAQAQAAAAAQAQANAVQENILLQQQLAAQQAHDQWVRMHQGPPGQWPHH